MSDLSKHKLTKSILQRCFKSKTYVRNREWDIIWYFGGKNNVTIAEKNGEYFLLPHEVIETVTEVLPFEIVQGELSHSIKTPTQINTLNELCAVFPELKNYLKGKLPYEY